MRVLFHQPLCPFSRKVRIVLAEKRIEADLRVEWPWERRPDFLALEPSGDVPVLVEDERLVLADATAIAEYLEETHPEIRLLPATPEARAEVRRLAGLFDGRFYREVTAPILAEKAIKRMSGGAAPPDSGAIRSAYAAIHGHLDQLAGLADQRSWLAGPELTLADITAAAHLSCLDYLGDVPWDRHPEARAWYSRIKSRPSLAPLLADRLPSIPPSRHYADRDF